MFLFVDGRAIVLTFNQVEQRYYAAFSDRFPEADVSLSQWRGGYEYQTLYPAMQQMVEAGTLTLEALNEVLGSIAAANEEIKRPAVLVSRVTERFAEMGIEATIRMADINTRGIVAICVDQGEHPNSVIGDVIRDEMLPAGQHMEGVVTYDTAISNGQPLTIRWALPVDTTIEHRVTITRRRGSPYPEIPVDDIVALFLSNFDEMMGIGLDLTPARYLTTSDLPWASSVLVEWTQDGTTWAATDKTALYTDRFIADLPPANVVIV